MDQESSPVAHTPSEANHACIKCGYDLTGCDLKGNCPECGTTILGECIWCEYDLSGTSTVAKCPECGVPAVHSIGHSALAAVPTKQLRSIHLGFRFVTNLILLYIIAIVAMILFGFMGAFLLNPSGTFFILLGIVAILTMLIPFGVVIGWFKLSKPMDGLPDLLDAPGRRKQLRVSLWVMTVTMLIFLALNIVLIPLQFGQGNSMLQASLIGARVLVFVAALISFIFMVRYMGWFARLVRNRKMYRRSKHLVWSGPLIAIVGFMLLLIGPLVTLVLYWNQVEYVRRDLKKIIRARTSTA